MADRDSIDVLKRNVEAFSKGDFDTFGSTLAKDSRYEEVATHRVTTTRDDAVEYNRGWRTAFPDVRGTIRNIFASGDKVVAEITWEGTHRGPLEAPAGMIAPTGRHINVPATLVATVRGGVIAESHHYFDMNTIVDQLKS